MGRVGMGWGGLGEAAIAEQAESLQPQHRGYRRCCCCCSCCLYNFRRHPGLTLMAKKEGK